MLHISFLNKDNSKKEENINTKWTFDAIAMS